MRGNSFARTTTVVVFLLMAAKDQSQPTVDNSQGCDNLDSDAYETTFTHVEVSHDEIRNMHQVITKLGEDLRGQRLEIIRLKEWNCSQQVQIVNFKKVLEVLVQNYTQKLSRIDQNNLEFRRMLSDQSHWNFTHEERLAAFETNYRQHDEHLVKLGEENDHLRTRVGELENILPKVNITLEQVAELKLANSSAHEELNALKTLINEQEEHLRQILQKNIVLEEKLLGLRHLNYSLQQTAAKQDQTKMDLQELNRTIREQTRMDLQELNRTIQEQIAQLERKNGVQDKRLQETNGSLSSELATLKQESRQHQQQLSEAAKQQPKDTVATYIRWGRKTCPQNSTSIFTGYMAGSHYTDKGGGSNYLCLPDRPQWGRTIDGVQRGGSFLHGVEYEMTANTSPFLTTNNGDSQLTNTNAPCTLCQTAAGRSNLLMIPGRTECFPGWHLQYRGYLASSHNSHNKKEYVCLDEAPEAIHGSHRNEDGALLYPVEAICGSLVCPSYVNGNEIACVVCVR